MKENRVLVVTSLLSLLLLTLHITDDILVGLEVAAAQDLQAKRQEWAGRLAEPTPARRRAALREIPMWDPRLESTYDLVFQALSDRDPETRIQAGEILVSTRQDPRGLADRQKWLATQAANPRWPATEAPSPAPESAPAPKRRPGGSLWLGFLALGYGVFTLYLRAYHPERLGKLEAMKEQWGEDAGTKVHWAAYTVLPILVGLALMAAGLR